MTLNTRIGLRHLRLENGQDFPKRHMWAAGRRRIADAQRARWARERAARYGHCRAWLCLLR